MFCNKNRFSRRVVFSVIAAVAIPMWAGPLAAAGDGQAQLGRLYLVGMGPGDPDLATVRALKVIRQADVVYCSPGVAARFGKHLQGKKIIEGYWRLFPFYGVEPSDVPAGQREEYERIKARRDEFIGQVRRAIAEGKVVVIADSGDPLIYGPWAWTLEEFSDLRPVVVPGLSCFNAANAALGCSITSGRQTKSVILTADDWPGMTDTIEKLSRVRATMVLFTMKADFERLIEKLREGWPADTPVAIVKFAGYRDKEEVVQATLGTILDRVDEDQLPFEYLIYVGDFLNRRRQGSTP